MESQLDLLIGLRLLPTLPPLTGENITTSGRWYSPVVLGYCAKVKSPWVKLCKVWGTNVAKESFLVWRESSLEEVNGSHDQ